MSPATRDSRKGRCAQGLGLPACLPSGARSGHPEKAVLHPAGRGQGGADTLQSTGPPPTAKTHLPKRTTVRKSARRRQGSWAGAGAAAAGRGTTRRRRDAGRLTLTPVSVAVSLRTSAKRQTAHLQWVSSSYVNFTSVKLIHKVKPLRVLQVNIGDISNNLKLGIKIHV